MTDQKHGPEENKFEELGLWYLSEVPKRITF